jgi:uncharacterized protein
MSSVRGSQAFQLHSIFLLPVGSKFLLYAPLHNLAVLMNRAAVVRLRDGLSGKGRVGAGSLQEVLEILKTDAEVAPRRKQGGLDPAFLGLIPTRACNLACGYCGFGATEEAWGVMSFELACAAVDWYVGLVRRAGKQGGEIHFFGGEPFSAEELIDAAVYYARARAQEEGIALRFEVATNGTFSARRCQWVADHLDTVVLSLDGPAEIHDRHRPYRGGQGSLEVVARNAEILSEGAAELCLRACITSGTVQRMEEMALWFCRAFRPQSVCFETLQPTAQAEAAGLHPPDPWEFAHNFIRAAQILEGYGVEPVYATADVGARRVSFCPVGQDVPIVSPDGGIAACYLLERDWEAKGLDLRMGHIEADGGVKVDMEAVEAIRELNVLKRPMCERCFCRWHCAGGCHVDHEPSGPAGAYDRLCIQTRTIALSSILKGMGEARLVWELLVDAPAMEAAVRQPSDRLVDWGGECGQGGA